MSNQPLRIDNICTDGGTQSRAQTNWLTVTDYAAEMAEGATFPPVVVFHDGAAYWLADGFHRIEAAKRLGLVDVDADVRAGSQRDALLYSVGANAKHGLRRTNDDKRRAVELLLNDAEWGRWSDREIARWCGVTAPTVAAVRQDICKTFTDAPRLVERNGQTYTMNTANIGKPAPIEDAPALVVLNDAVDGTDAEYEYLRQQALDARRAGWDVSPPAAPDPMAVHYSSKSDEHYTPAHIVDLVVAVMGEIDLDPCSNSHDAPNVPALEYYTKDDDGLVHPWFGRVYMNPPYGDVIGDWTSHLIAQYREGNVTEAIALVPARMDTQWFAPLWDYTLCFVQGRLKFSQAGVAPFPSVAVYIGPCIDRFAQSFNAIGVTVRKF